MSRFKQLVEESFLSITEDVDVDGFETHPDFITKDRQVMHSGGHFRTQYDYIENLEHKSGKPVQIIIQNGHNIYGKSEQHGGSYVRKATVGEPNEFYKNPDIKKPIYHELGHMKTQYPVLDKTVFLPNGKHKQEKVYGGGLRHSSFQTDRNELFKHMVDHFKT